MAHLLLPKTGFPDDILAWKSDSVVLWIRLFVMIRIEEIGYTSDWLSNCKNSRKIVNVRRWWRWQWWWWCSIRIISIAMSYDPPIDSYKWYLSVSIYLAGIMQLIKGPCIWFLGLHHLYSPLLSVTLWTTSELPSICSSILPVSAIAASHAPKENINELSDTLSPEKHDPSGKNSCDVSNKNHILWQPQTTAKCCMTKLLYTPNKIIPSISTLWFLTKVMNKSL